VLLSDREIYSAIENGDVLIDPYDADLIQPSSLDMRLGDDFRVMTAGPEAIDPRAVTDWTKYVLCEQGDLFVLRPGEFVLAQTLERVGLPAWMAAKLEGKSSLGRLGLELHATAGFIDPGFHGTITLELSLVSPRPLILYPGMKIGQLAFYSLSSPAMKPYGTAGLGSHYQDQEGPTISRYEL
jgi:dCTP deaminase